MNTKKNYCPIPFGHVNVTTNGDYNVCCNHRVPVEKSMNIKTHEPQQWLANPYLEEVREAFRQDQRHPGCVNCWRMEDGMEYHSLRTRSQREYAIMGITGYEFELAQVEVQMGNLCNLTCVMCDPTQSSAINGENRRLGVFTVDQKHYNWNDEAFANLEKLLALGPRLMNMRGGEPFYNKQFLEILENLPEDTFANTILHVTTNVTQWNPRWRSALSRFRLVRMMFSIDAHGDLYEYIRYPASWSQVEANMLDIITMPNVKPVVHTTVQNLNIGHLGTLMQWCYDHGIYQEMDLLLGPEFMQISVLPQQLKIQAMEHLRFHRQQRAYSSRLIAYIDHYINRLRLSLDDDVSALWQKCLDHLTMRDQLRGNDHRRFLEY